VRTPKIVLGDVNQWALVAVEDFSKPNLKARGWSDDKRSECGGSGDFYLGGYCKFGDTKVTKTFHRLPVHSHLRLQARFHFFDKWEGQYAYAMINDKIVWIQNHRHCTSIFANNCKGINVCGDESFSDRLSVPISVDIPHDNRPLHPALAPIELRSLGLAPHHSSHGPKVLPKPPKGVSPMPPTGLPTLTTDPAATNRFIDIESDDMSLAGEPPSVGAAPAMGAVAGPAGVAAPKKAPPPLKPNYNNTDTVTITFGAVMPMGDPCVASWGVDDIELFTLLKHDDHHY